MELLADEAEVPLDRLQEYWALAADLITLVADIEEYRQSNPAASYDEPAMLALRRRLREISARLSQLVAE